MITTYLALDPGGTTGWVRYSPEAPSLMRFVTGQLGPEEHHERLYALLEREHTQKYTVICESFEFRQNKQRDNINLMSREYIGVVKLFRKERNVPVVFQTAGAAKGFVTDEKLKAMGLWVPGQKHAMDAMRHLVFYLVNVERRVDLIQSWKEL